MEARRESSTVDTKRGRLSAALLTLSPSAAGQEPGAPSADDILFSKGAASTAAFRRLPAQATQNDEPGGRHITGIDRSAAAPTARPLFRSRGTRFGALIGAACAPVFIIAAILFQGRAPQPVPHLAAEPPEPVITATPTPVPPPRPVPSTPARDPAQDKAALVAQGSLYLDHGDIASARLYFEKAAEAGDSHAAMLMGATYDPAYLARLKTRGLRGNIAQAIGWYRRARTLGAPEAAQLLAELETR